VVGFFILTVGHFSVNVNARTSIEIEITFPTEEGNIPITHSLCFGIMETYRVKLFNYNEHVRLSFIVYLFSDRY
jgi:hypothetical protein